jgi:hypothetical protein
MGSDGAQNTIHAVAMESGKLLRTYQLNVKRRGDWESISLGPCGGAATAVSTTVSDDEDVNIRSDILDADYNATSLTDNNNMMMMIAAKSSSMNNNSTIISTDNSTSQQQQQQQRRRHHPAQECLYLHNGGNNAGARCNTRSCTRGRDHHYIHKLVEPNVNDSDSDDDDAINVVTLRYNYADPSWPTNQNDCEAMFVDFTGDMEMNMNDAEEEDSDVDSDQDAAYTTGHPGDIYIMTKQPYDRVDQRIGKIPVSLHSGLAPLEDKNGYYDVWMKAIGKASVEVPWSGADMSRGGNLIAARRDDLVYFYPRLQGETVVQAMVQPACPYVSQTYRDGNDMNRFEAVTFVSDYDHSYDYSMSDYANEEADADPSRSASASRPPHFLEVSECAQKEACHLPVVEYKLLYQE